MKIILRPKNLKEAFPVKWTAKNHPNIEAHKEFRRQLYQHSKQGNDHIYICNATKGWGMITRDGKVYKNTKEDAPVNCVGGGMIAGAAGDPPVNRVPKLLRRKKKKLVEIAYTEITDKCGHKEHMKDNECSTKKVVTKMAKHHAFVSHETGGLSIHGEGENPVSDHHRYCTTHLSPEHVVKLIHHLRKAHPEHFR